MKMKHDHDAGDSTLEIDPDKNRELRCECGRLQARITPLGIELKCGRCKRLTTIPYKKRTKGK